MPLLSVRTNAWVIKVIHQNRSEKKTPILKYLPTKDRTSVIVGFFATGLFAYVITGYCCKFEHLVCQ